MDFCVNTMKLVFFFTQGYHRGISHLSHPPQQNITSKFFLCLFTKRRIQACPEITPCHLSDSLKNWAFIGSALPMNVVTELSWRVGVKWGIAWTMHYYVHIAVICCFSNANFTCSSPLSEDEMQTLQLHAGVQLMWKWNKTFCFTHKSAIVSFQNSLTWILDIWCELDLTPWSTAGLHSCHNWIIMPLLHKKDCTFFIVRKGRIICRNKLQYYTNIHCF